jgi:Zn-dependent metalloprotease
MALSFLTAALAAGVLCASAPQESLRVNAAASRLMAQRAELGLNADHAFALRATNTDDLGQTHGRFAQMYKGVKVWGGEIITHSDRNGRELAHTNALYSNIQLNVTPSIETKEALAIADADLAPKGAYAYAPTAELVVLPETVLTPKAARAARNADDFEQGVVRYTLAYFVHAQLENGADETIHRNYLIDAHTGAILRSWNDLHTADAVGTGKSQFSGTVSIHTSTATSGWNLVDTYRAMNISTYNLNHGTSGTGTIYNDADNSWGDGTNYTGSTTSTTSATGQTAAVDAHYGVEMTYDFYKNVLGRNGIDGNNKATYSRVHYSTSYDNAYWDDTCFCMTYGDGSSFKSLESLDVAGHEMSHGVCANTANLTYSGESGGLNEANSDMMGNMVELYAHNGFTLPATVPNTDPAWTVGEQLETSSFPTPLRYMYKPSKDGSSKDAWSSTLGSLDVHYSSGPANRMFFFLSQGASATSTSDYYSSYTSAGFTGIGPEKATKIWYRALSVYMTASTNYAAARTACISAVKDLYGAGGAEEQAVWNAFAAINVGSKWSGGTTTDTTAPTASATESGTSGTITFSATATDNVGVTKVEFYVDGVLKGTDTTSPYSMTLDSTTLTNATHSLTVKAYDAAGNVGTSTAVSFTVSNTTTGTTYTEVESNNTTSTANVVADTVTKIVGYMSSTTDKDYFKVNVKPGKSITVNMTGPSGVDYDLYFLNSSGTTLKSSLGSTATETITYSNTSTTATVFYIYVKAYSGSSTTTPYNLALTR